MKNDQAVHTKNLVLVTRHINGRSRISLGHMQFNEPADTQESTESTACNRPGSIKEQPPFLSD